MISVFDIFAGHVGATIPRKEILRMGIVFIFFIFPPFSIISAQELDISSTAIERATHAKEDSVRALERVEKAQDTAQRAELAAEKALSESQNAIEGSDRRFASIQVLLYVISAVVGAFGVISVLFEFNRRRTEEIRFQKFVERQERFDKVQIQLDEKILSGFDKIFDKQIEGLGKLGQVIDTVQRAFNIQIEESEAKKEYIKKAEKLEETLASYQQHYMHQFDRVCKEIEPLKDMSRLGWTRISQEQQNLARAARAIFVTIPTSVFTGMEDQGRVGRLCYLLGLSAFYDNDIATASDLLGRAKEVYDKWIQKDLSKTEHRHSYAFCHHYLGLIEKNWCQKELSPISSLEKARDYLQTANETLIQDEGELLTPLTLAEILSYLPNERNYADSQIQRCIKKVEDIRLSGKKLNANQQSLLGRAHLLKGNLEYLEGRPKDALKSYAKSLEESPGYFYGLFSQGHVEKKLGRLSDAVEAFKKSLEVLQRSKVLDKPEVITRGTVLAQAVIAAHHAKDPRKDDYLNLFRDLVNRAHQVGDRNPMFFGPITKKLVAPEQLSQEVQEECEVA